MKRLIQLVPMLAVALLLHAQSARADDVPLPNGTIRIVVPYVPGGPLDLVARVVAEKLTQRTHRNVIVENRPGAAGNIAGRFVAAAAPDGLTLLATGDSLYTVNPFFYTNPSFDADKSLALIGFMGIYSPVLVVSSKIPVHTLPDVIRYSKTTSLNFGSGGNGSPGHLGFAYLHLLTGVQGVLIPYKGSADIDNALLAGQVDAGVISVPAADPLVRSGKVTAIAVASHVRDPVMPQVPTAAEAGLADFEITFAFLLAGPAGLPPATTAFLNQQTNAIFDLPDVRARLRVIGISEKQASPMATREWLTIQEQRWQKTITASNMRTQ